MIICITGHHDQFNQIISSHPVQVYQYPLDIDVIKYTIDTDDSTLVEALDPIQYVPIDISVPIPTGAFVDPQFSTQIEQAKELVRVLMARILGVNVKVNHYYFRSYPHDLLVLVPVTSRGTPETSCAVYRSRSVVLNFKAQFDPSLLLAFQVVHPHPMSMLALAQLSLGLPVRYLEDIPVLPATDQLNPIKGLELDNLTRSLIADGWQVIEVMSDLERKVELLKYLGPVEVISHPTHTSVFYRPDPGLLVPADWIDHPSTLTLIGPWMDPPISDTIVVGGGLPRSNPVGTPSGTQQQAAKLTNQLLPVISQWTIYRAKLFWNSSEFRGWVSPTLSVIIPTDPKWRTYLDIMNRPVDDIIVTPIPSLDQGNLIRQRITGRSVLIPANFNFNQPDGFFLLTKGPIQDLLSN